MGKLASDLFPTAVQHFYPIVEKIFRERIPYSWETFFPDLNQYMSFTSIPFDEYFFTMGFDTSEERKAQFLSQKLDMMARMATEASAIGVWELDLDSGVLTWNEQMYRIFEIERKPGPLDAMDWASRLHPEDREAAVTKLNRCIDSLTEFVGDFRIVTPSRGIRTIRARSEVLQSAVTQTRVMIGTNIDITEEIENIEALVKARQLADRASQAKSAFLASMSHELRTPLNGVLGYAQLLRLKSASALGRSELDYIDHIIQSGEHLLNLINDVLDLAKVEQGDLALDLGNVNAAKIVERAVDLTKPISEAKAVTVVIRDFSTGTGEILCDTTRVTQILLNLLSNAIKFSPEGGEVVIEIAEVEADGAGEQVRIAVTDNGPGVPADRRDAIFEPFARLEDNPMKTADSVGIGLSVTKSLTRKMGGDIGVESEVGRGSTFWVAFPKA